jgi:mono/diheme cytochrome c family protein
MNMRTILVCAVMLVFALTSWVSAQVTQGNPKAGQTVYEKNCLRCHGSKLDGNGPDSQDLIVRPADLQSLGSRAKADWELLVTITNGALFTPMHGFRGKLSDQQILDVLSYIRTVAPFDAVS